MSRQRFVMSSLVSGGRSETVNAYTAVRYQGHWFSIDQSDWHTKRALGLVILLFTLTDTGNGERLPVLTIPAN